MGWCSEATLLVPVPSAVTQFCKDQCVTSVGNSVSMCCVTELCHLVPKDGFPKTAARNTSGIGTTADKMYSR